MLPSVSRSTLAFAAALLGSVVLASTMSQSTPAVHASGKADRAAGGALFHEKGCEHCHGADGIGGEKGPNLSGVGRELRREEIQQQILDGGNAMPAFADALSPDETKLLVDYLSAKKKVIKSQKAAGTPAPSAAKPNMGGSDDQ